MQPLTDIRDENGALSKYILWPTSHFDDYGRSLAIVQEHQGDGQWRTLHFRVANDDTRSEQLDRIEESVEANQILQAFFVKYGVTAWQFLDFSSYEVAIGVAL